jgi:hypothetical protein
MVIDAVITWVDGKDPKHVAKRNNILKAIPEKNQAHVTSALEALDEIRYCVESIIRFAPYIRTIFIVTDEQIPEVYYQYPDRIKIIDHKEIFKGYETFLPTINIFSIETLLYRIPNLSEHFIYLNDDFFLIKPTQIEDWFINEYPVLRGRWELHAEHIWYKRLATTLGLRKKERAGFRNTQSTSAKQLGFHKKFFRCFHTPRALRKSTFEQFFNNHPEMLQEQIRHRVRTASQFNPYGLMWHLEIKNKTAHIAATTGILEIHNPHKKSTKTIKKLLTSTEANPDLKFLNIQGLNLASTDVQLTINQWLQKVILDKHNA